MKRVPEPLVSPRLFFGPRRHVVSASAPGRLDVMGGIADYSGSLVLEMPTKERAHVAAAVRKDGVWRVYSREAQRAGLRSTVQAPTKDLATPVKARAALTKDPQASWAAYVLGAVPYLLEKGMPRCGADLHLSSDVPLSKGLSSSAAIEVATMAALCRSFGIRLGETELPILCQKAENHVAGAPCGLMDQLTCHLGRKDRLLPILCQPDLVEAPVVIPPGIRFMGVDSGVRHWVGGSSYSDVRAAAFMGYSLIALKDGATLKDLRRARRMRDASRLPHGGYLARIYPPLFESRYKSSLPETLSGRDFLGQACSIDRATDIVPDVLYRVRACTAHPVYENLRVEIFRTLLGSLLRMKDPQVRRGILLQLGDLMVQSHASYGACGLGEPVTDAIVEEVVNAGPDREVYGAKITGGGSGGTVCVLADGSEGLSTVRDIASRILKGVKSFISLGSSDGSKWR